jgi:hypothetical protein
VSAHAGRPLRDLAVERLTRVHPRVEATHDQRERPEQAHRTRTEHEGPRAATITLARRRPRQTLLHIPRLDQRLLRDRQRLDEDANVAQRRRHHVHVALVVDELLGHEPVASLDATLGEVTGEAEVLTTGPARPALGMRARTPHHRDDEIARLHARHTTADARHPRERLVTDHEVVRAVGRDAVVEARDLLVRAAHADVEHVEQHVGVALERRRGVIGDDRDGPVIREHGDGAHSSTVDPTGPWFLRSADNSRR